MTALQLRREAVIAASENRDIGAVNLMCALGLPGAENIDAAKYHRWLDDAARAVEFDTKRHWYRFMGWPGAYRNSLGYFCCSFLLQVLQEDFNVRYNPARVRDPTFQDPKCIDPDFRDSRDLFIHGIIDGPGGTCASMPVLYVAVGRRLGYPLKLVETRGHLFIRWDDPCGCMFGVTEVFNIDGAGYGMASKPDDFYRTWPDQWTKADIEGGCYLKSLSREEELAAFLGTRGECLFDNGRIDEAIQAWTWASGLVPHDARYRSRLRGLLHQREASTAIALLEWQKAHRCRLPQPHSQRIEAPAHSPTCKCYHCCQAGTRDSQSRGRGGQPASKARPYSTTRP